jgi:hypothetical protein
MITGIFIAIMWVIFAKWATDDDKDDEYDFT